MALQAVLDNLDDLDASLHEHYKKDEKSGKFILDLTDFDSVPRVRVLKDEAAQHRIKARNAENALAPFKALGEPEKVREQLDRIAELEELAKGNVDDTKVEKLVEARVKGRLAPIERERDQLKTKAGELEAQVQQYGQRERTRTVEGAVRAAVGKSKGFQAEAVEDVLLYAERVFELNDAGDVVTKDGVGVPAGLSPADWLADMQPKRPHWWGPSAGTGARGNNGGGGAGNNPWSHDNWNMTEQGRLYRENPARAKQLAQLAGTTIGGARPAAKR